MTSVNAAGTPPLTEAISFSISDRPLARSGSR